MSNNGQNSYTLPGWKEGSPAFGPTATEEGLLRFDTADGKREALVRAKRALASPSPSAALLFLCQTPLQLRGYPALATRFFKLERAADRGGLNTQSEFYQETIRLVEIEMKILDVREGRQ
jgi:hypothetical protein